MPLSPYEMISTYSALDKTQRLDRWTTLRAAPPEQELVAKETHTEPIDAVSTTAAKTPTYSAERAALPKTDVEPATSDEPDVAQEANAATASAPPEKPTPQQAAQARPMPRQFYDSIINRHSKASRMVTFIPVQAPMPPAEKPHS